jgi:aryl hydrocarbon receptor nuclear translocator-like protein 1
LTNFNALQCTSAAGGRDIQKLISTHVEASKIGRQIAEEVLDSQRHGGDSSSDGSPSPDTETALPQQVTSPSAEVLVH